MKYGKEIWIQKKFDTPQVKREALDWFGGILKQSFFTILFHGQRHLDWCRWWICFMPFGSWRSWVVGVGCCFFFWSNSYGGWPRCFFCLVINLVQSNEGFLIWNQHHFKIVEELPKWCTCYIRESTNFLFNGDGFGIVIQMGLIEI